MTSTVPVPYSEFCESPGRYIQALARREVLLLTKNERPVAQVRRLPALRADVDRETAGLEVLLATALRSNALDRLIAISDGQRFVLGRGGRREAVIEGVKT